LVSQLPQHASQEEEPFEIELVVPGSLVAQGAPAEEQQQQEEDHGINNEDKDDEEYSPMSDKEGEKLYNDADEMESIRAEGLVPTGRLHALLVHLSNTTAPRYRIKGVPHPGLVEFRVVVEIFNETWVISKHQGPAFRASISDVVTDAA
jgi:hypothetical protein